MFSAYTQEVNLKVV